VSHTSGNIILHLVFSTVERHPLITPVFRDDLFAYLGGIVRGIHATALIVNGTADHVHMLVRIRPSQSAAELARVIKANSSGWVREECSLDFSWQTGYGVFSVSESYVAAVTRYIANQEEHHRKHSFRKSLPHFPRRTMWPTTRNTSGDSLCRPFGALKIVSYRQPTACAVGCILAPLRG